MKSKDSKLTKLLIKLCALKAELQVYNLIFGISKHARKASESLISHIYHRCDKLMEEGKEVFGDDQEFVKDWEKAKKEVENTYSAFSRLF